ncbi:MAG: hypothetical protein AAF747_01030 [Planctomycetota bacterium]
MIRLVAQDDADNRRGVIQIARMAFRRPADMGAEEYEQLRHAWLKPIVALQVIIPSITLAVPITAAAFAVKYGIAIIGLAVHSPVIASFLGFVIVSAKGWHWSVTSYIRRAQSIAADLDRCPACGQPMPPDSLPAEPRPNDTATCRECGAVWLASRFVDQNQTSKVVMPAPGQVPAVAERAVTEKSASPPAA